MNQVESQLPSEFIERLRHIIPSESLQHVIDAFSVQHPTTFRTNTLKGDTSSLREHLQLLGFHTEHVSWYGDAFVLVNKSLRELTEMSAYKDGQLYVQSLSSMIPPLILGPEKNELIGDITAAPGSKTTQIAAMMNNTGHIVANDKSRIRSYKLEANLKLQGVTNTETTHMAGQEFWYHYPEYFDRILVDVPCSMEGRFYSKDPRTYEDWSVKKIRELVQIQRFILRSAVSATKPGGTIVYSTCTLAPEENEGIIDWILGKEKNVLDVEDISFDIEGKQGGLTEWNGKKYDERLKKTLRILPSPVMEGFYVAKLKKVTSNIPSSSRA